MSEVFGSVGKVHEECAHVGSACLITVIGDGVGVGQKLVAEPQVFREDRLSLLAIGPDFVVLSLSMRPHDGLKCAPLKPAHEQLRDSLHSSPIVSRASDASMRGLCAGVIVGGNGRRKEAGDIGVPVRHAARGEVQACGNGALQHVPGGKDVAGPKDRAIALRSQVSGAG